MSLTITGLLAVIMGIFIENTEIAHDLAGDIVLVGGIIVAWIGRYRIGDISLTGRRK